MRIWPTWKKLGRTLALGWLVAFGVMALSYHYLWRLYEAKWDEVLETAIFNDLDGDGYSVVEVSYDVEQKSGE